MQWKDVKKTLPEMFCHKTESILDEEEQLIVVSEVVLVTDGDGVEPGFIEKGVWVTESSCVLAKDITHWMPFPKPPAAVKKVSRKTTTNTAST